MMNTVPSTLMNTIVIGQIDKYTDKYTAKYYIWPQSYINYTHIIHINVSEPYKQFSPKVGSSKQQTNITCSAHRHDKGKLLRVNFLVPISLGHN